MKARPALPPKDLATLMSAKIALEAAHTAFYALGADQSATRCKREANRLGAIYDRELKRALR